VKIKIFNTYGPKTDPNDGYVVSNFNVQALQNQDITVYRQGNQTRNFQYVYNLVEGMIRLMNSRDSFTGPVSVRNPNESTILKIALKIIKLNSSKSKIICQPLPSDNPMRRQPDISLVQQELAWSPKVNLDEGLIKTISFFESNN
jgi:UDP-glucuronate decarboxylase